MVRRNVNYSEKVLAYTESFEKLIFILIFVGRLSNVKRICVEKNCTLMSNILVWALNGIAPFAEININQIY